MSAPTSLSPFLHEFWRFDRSAVLKTIALNLGVALLEGLGLMLLVPLLSAAGLVGAGLGVALPFSLPQGVSEMLGRLGPQAKLIVMLATFVGLISLQSVLTWWREWQSQDLQVRFVDSLRTRLFGELTYSRWSFLSRHHSSEFLSVLTTDVQRVGTGALFLMQLLTQLALLPVYLVVAFQLSAMVSMIALVTGAVLWWFLRSPRDLSTRSGMNLSRANQRMFNQIQEFLGALKLIKIHGQEAGYRHQFSEVITHLRAQQNVFQLERGRAQMAYRIGGALALSLLTYVSLGYLQLAAANLLVLVAIFSRTLPKVSQVHTNLQQLLHMVPAFTSWQQWLRACGAEAEVPQVAHENFKLEQGISLVDVSFKHPLGYQPVSVTDLFIPARQTTVIVGPTGSGKTTLLDLLSGLNRPDSGQVMVDGQALSDPTKWRSHIAYVPQDSAIFDGTLRDNLCWGASGVTDAQLFEVLEQAAASEFVARLPQSLDTWVGERGVRLSGGEKQRLSLARALLRHPLLLILDEATSALDREHQQVILEALRRLRGRMTLIVVTHRHEEIMGLVDGVVHVEAGHVSGWVPVVDGAS